MPGPVSLTRMTLSPSRRSKASATRPPAGVNFTALSTRLATASNKKIAVAMHDRRIGGLDLQGDALVLGDRLVEIAHLAHQRDELDLAEALEPAAVLDLGDAQQRRDDGERLVETGDRLIDDRPQVVQRFGAGPPALEPHPHPGERRAQIVRDVVADPGISRG